MFDMEFDIDIIAPADPGGKVPELYDLNLNGAFACTSPAGSKIIFAPAVIV